MKDNKLNQIFAAVRHETLPDVPVGFAERVQRTIATTGRAGSVVIGFFDLLNRNFTRYAIGAAAAIMLCAAVEFSQSFGKNTSIDDDVEQICSDWMLH